MLYVSYHPFTEHEYENIFSLLKIPGVCTHAHTRECTHTTLSHLISSQVFILSSDKNVTTQSRT